MINFRILALAFMAVTPVAAMSHAQGTTIERFRGVYPQVEAPSVAESAGTAIGGFLESAGGFVEDTSISVQERGVAETFGETAAQTGSAIGGLLERGGQVLEDTSISVQEEGVVETFREPVSRAGVAIGGAVERGGQIIEDSSRSVQDLEAGPAPDAGSANSMSLFGPYGQPSLIPPVVDENAGIPGVNDVPPGYVSDIAPTTSDRPAERPSSIRMMGDFAADPASKIHAIVDISSQTVTVRGPGINETWPVSTGRSGYSTPTGHFYGVEWFSPNHKSSLYDDAPMPWSIFFNGNIAFHGTTAVNALGSADSHGCIRLETENARKLYETVHAAGAESFVVTVR